MKIAVTIENENVFQHFGHSEKFKIYTVDEGKIIGSVIVPTMGKGHGALASFLMLNGADAVICGGIGAGAKDALSRSGIQVFGGVSGNADEAVNALLNGTLKYNPNIMCSHHGSGHNCSGHSCS